MKRICVNCGSSPGFADCYMAMAHELGQVILENKYELVYGGANVGLMGEVAETVLNGGGRVIGIIPESFAHKVSHQGLTKLHIVGSMHERKQMMFDLSDAFIALPGGFGTIEEMTEILTWAQLNLHTKPCGLINVNNYYDQLLSFFDHSVANGFMKQVHRDMLLVSKCSRGLLNQIESYRPPNTEKWVGVKTRT